jgi:hypothetical protein
MDRLMFFWLSPRDQRHNNWIFYKESARAGVRLREELLSLQCPKCRKIDELAALETPISKEVKIRSKSDYLITDDGLICMTMTAQSVVLDAGVSGLRFIPIPGDCRYSIVLPAEFILTTRDKVGMEFHRPCPACGRYRETCGSPAIESLSLTADTRSIVCPDVPIERTRSRQFWYLASEDVVSLFRDKALTGLDYNAAY